MRAFILPLSIIILLFHPVTAQQEEKPFTTPKLVVGIVVDQMRYDYLTRFWDDYGQGGFHRLVTEGFNCMDNHFNYAPTSTAPGHASVYTGTTPAIHGIIGNNWYDKRADEMVYCVRDTSVSSVGTRSDAGKMSPHRLKVTTWTDQLRLHYQKRSKVIAVSIKDRGAVLPGGHTANAAYWFKGGKEGNWISSSFYMDKLPSWVNEFNASGKAASYKKPWKLFKNESEYEESNEDNTPYEGLFQGKTVPEFPYDLPSLWDANGGYELLKVTPYGNSLTTDFALEAMEKEGLGEDEIPDALAISYSATDYIGHKFGVDSKEVQDAYLRLDKDIERLLDALDKKVGEGEYLVFLTADHGAIPVPSYLADQKVPAGYTWQGSSRDNFANYLNEEFGTDEVIANYSNDQIFLDRKVLDSLGLTVSVVTEKLAEELLEYEDIAQVYTARQMKEQHYTNGLSHILQMGFNHNRSGDLLLVPRVGHISYPETGSTHGSVQIYDTHVPLLFYGKGIKPGRTYQRTVIPDIAPTISALLGIAYPNGATGNPIDVVLE